MFKNDPEVILDLLRFFPEFGLVLDLQPVLNQIIVLKKESICISCAFSIKVRELYALFLKGNNWIILYHNGWLQWLIFGLY